MSFQINHKAELPKPADLGDRFVLYNRPSLAGLFYHRDSKTCGRATAQKFSDFAQNLEICMRKLNFFYFNLVFTVFSSFFTHIK